MTQKYIPVEWTDETPTQPGTLINKARMDQMQSAHHFADGFEEVDAIPTEDPGTEYHKVVYCTADSTFYRWDGAQWTADIDDDTKRLLEEHEADHSNPHQVTKAQVGLGNADNTSDADKPISTATAAALATKADKATTLAGYGIGDAYTKAQVDGKLADGSVTKLGTADVGSDTKPIKLVGGSPTPVADALAKDSTVVHLTGDTLTGALFSESAGANSYNGARLSADKYSTKATGFDVTSTATYGKAHPLPGITDDNGVPALRTIAYLTGSEMRYGMQFLDTAKGSHVQELLTFNRTAGTIASPLVQAALDAYLPMVRTANAQTIGGIKTFTDGIIAYAQGWHGTYGNNQAQGQWAIFAKIHPTSVGGYHYIEFTQNSNTAVAYGTLTIHESAVTPFPVWINRVSRGSNDPLGNANSVTVLSDGTDLYLAWKRETPYGGLGARSFFGSSYGAVRVPDQNITWYDAADRTVLSTLDGYTVHDPEDREVRTVGVQDIAGDKRFLANMALKKNNLDVSVAPSSNQYWGLIFTDKNDKEFGGLRAAYPTTRDNYLYLALKNLDTDQQVATLTFYKDHMTGPARAYNASNTSDIVTLGLLDGYTPMVRTTGNQSIGGSKEFINPIKGQMFELAYFGSNTTAGWYAIAKFPKVAREIYLMTFTPGNLNFLMLETNTHSINVVKWVGNYTPNQNRYMWVETADNMILYVYSATYRTNIINLLNYSVYGTPTALSEIDKSVFTGQPVTKPEVGGDIVAVYDETILNMVTS